MAASMPIRMRVGNSDEVIVGEISMNFATGERRSDGVVTVKVDPTVTFTEDAIRRQVARGMFS